MTNKEMELPNKLYIEEKTGSKMNYKLSIINAIKILESKQRRKK